jgi:hypothetical protein
MFRLGGVVESFVPDATAAETCTRIGKVIAAGVIGCIGLWAIAIAWSLLT